MQSSSKPESDLELGEIVGDRYRIDAFIGRGGYGRVYRATQLPIDRVVAVKVVDPGDREAVARFRREAELVKQLEHPNTVRVFDVGTSKTGVPFVVMELLRGGSVHELLGERGKLPPRTALEIAGQVLASLGEAHQKGIVHRDIKPENVFVTSHVGQPIFVKVLDFGIAKRQRSTETVLTVHGEAPGTPNYMAPEQVLGMETDARTDIYAVGLLLAEMLTGRTVFDVGGPRTLMLAQLDRGPAPLDPILEQLPGGAIVRKAVEKQPKDRYTSASEMLAAIDVEKSKIDRASHTPAPAPPPAAAPTWKSVAETRVLQVASPPARPHDAGRKRLVFGLLGAVLLLLMVVVGLLAVIFARDVTDTPKKRRASSAEEISTAPSRLAPTSPREAPVTQVAPGVPRPRTIAPEKVEALLEENGYSVWAGIEGPTKAGYTLTRGQCTGTITLADFFSAENAQRVIHLNRGQGAEGLIEGSVVMLVFMARLNGSGPNAACVREVVDLLAAPR